MYVCFRHRFVPSAHFRRFNDGITYTAQCPGGDDFVYAEGPFPANRDDHKAWKMVQEKYERQLATRRRMRTRRPRRRR